VSVGGLLALDQVLRKHWLGLNTFLTLTGWSNMESPIKAEIAGSHLFCGPNKGLIRDFVIGYGMSAHGFTRD
jgi:hypothetical protein